MNTLARAINKIFRFFLVRQFASSGTDIVFFPTNSEFSFKSISLGKRIFIGPRAYFRSAHGEIKIGNNVMFGPSVFILGGDHIMDQVGEYMIDVTKDPDHRDQSIIIEDDAWIGARATILSGVKVGEGGVVAAGCVVSRSIPPYEIHGGVPNRKIGQRFTAEEQEEHRAKLKAKNV